MTTSQLSIITPTSRPTTTTIVPLPTHPARTVHPLFNSHFVPTVRTLLLSFYDIAMITFLILHITMFFYLLEANWEACDRYSTPYPENFLDPMKTGMTVRARCQRINTDMYVSGGLDVALCFILLSIHVWHLIYRAWDTAIHGIQTDDKPTQEKVMSIDGSEESQVLITRSLQTDEGRSVIRFRDWSVERGRKRTRNSTREGSTRYREKSTSVDSSKWSEILLECLVP